MLFTSIQSTKHDVARQWHVQCCYSWTYISKWSCANFKSCLNLFYHVRPPNSYLVSCMHVYARSDNNKLCSHTSHEDKRHFDSTTWLRIYNLHSFGIIYNLHSFGIIYNLHSFGIIYNLHSFGMIYNLHSFGIIYNIICGIICTLLGIISTVLWYNLYTPVV